MKLPDLLSQSEAHPTQTGRPRPSGKLNNSPKIFLQKNFPEKKTVWSQKKVGHKKFSPKKISLSKIYIIMENVYVCMSVRMYVCIKAGHR